MRTKFDEQLDTLGQELIKMGSLCEEVISLAASALVRRHDALAAKIAPLDHEIDEKERQIEAMCLRLLLQQQPVAGDLRQISAALKMVTDMERIGDQAEEIAEILPFLNGRTLPEHIRIREMAKATIKMVTDSVDPYVRQDTTIAEAVIASDDIVDDYFKDIKSSLISLIAQNPTEGEYALDLLMVAKYFERIGDHAANIAGWVLFSVTGEKDAQPPTG